MNAIKNLIEYRKRMRMLYSNPKPTVVDIDKTQQKIADALYELTGSLPSENYAVSLAFKRILKIIKVKK